MKFLSRLLTSELAAINGNTRIREEPQLSAKNYELSADFADRIAIVFAKVRDGF